MAKTEPVAEDRCRCGTSVFVYLNRSGLAYSNCGKCRRHVREYSMNASRQYLEGLGSKVAEPPRIHGESTTKPPAAKPAPAAPAASHETVAKPPRIGFATLLGKGAEK